MTSPRPESAPLNDAELDALREITQHLTRTDPGLLESGQHRPCAGRRLLAGAVLVACLVVGVLAVAAGATAALGVGVGLVGAVTVVTTIGLRRASARRPPDTP